MQDILHALPSALVSVEWLANHQQQDNLIVLDASWHMPDQERDAKAEWHSLRIPGAGFFDFDGRICQPDTELPHMFPDPETFNREVQKLGIHQDNQIVIYDTLGVFASPRAWWMFKAMGHDNVAVLNGGLPAWQAAGLSVETNTPTTVAPGNFQGEPQSQWLSGIPEVQQALTNGTPVIDVRPVERFYGQVAEPRPGLRAGHMPGAINFPFTTLLDAQLALRPYPELAQQFQQHGLDNKEQKLTFSCGSGVSACITALAAYELGFRQLSVYDGSWTEWGQVKNAHLSVSME